MFITSILILIFLSFLLSLGALRAELKKSKKTEEVATELAKGRVVFHAPEPINTSQENKTEVTTFLKQEK